MTEKEQEQHDQIQQLHKKLAEMEGDIRTTVSTFLGVMKSLNINTNDFQGGTADIGAKLPGILSKITMQVVSGSFDTQSIANITAVSPIMEKYKYLVEDILTEVNDGK